MATGYALPPPPALEIHSPNAADKGKKFFLAWENYALATELSKKAEGVQVATLLTVIGEEPCEVYSTFNDWANDGDDKKIKPVLKKFREYYEPRKNIPFERFKFNHRMQEPEKRTTNTARPCESLPIAIILNKLHQRRYFVIV